MFYERLDEIMKAKGLSIPDVARLSNLQDSTVRSIIKRKSETATLDVAIKISKGLSVSISYFNGDLAESTTESSGLFSLKLKVARERSGMSQRELANKIGVRAGAVGNWESGLREPSLATVAKLAIILGIEVSELMPDNALSSEKSLANYSVINTLAKDKNISLETLANKAGITYANLLQIVGNMVDGPKFTTMKAIADVLAISVDQLAAHVGIGDTAIIQKDASEEASIMVDISDGLLKLSSASLDKVLDYVQLLGLKERESLPR